jgi:hypothetical protein
MQAAATKDFEKESLMSPIKKRIAQIGIQTILKKLVAVAD